MMLQSTKELVDESTLVNFTAQHYAYLKRYHFLITSSKKLNHCKKNNLRMCPELENYLVLRPLFQLQDALSLA